MKPSPATTRRLIMVGVLVLWEALPRLGLIPELFLPPLSKTIMVGLTDWREYGSELLVTLSEVIVAMILSCGGGIVIGAIIGSVARLRGFLLPVISSLYAVPLVILYPVFTVWFGIGPPSKIALATFLGILPAILTTAAGIQTIDEQLLVAARSMGATLTQRIVRVVVPAAIPTMLAGIRIGGALTIVGVVVAEMLVSAAGIGYLISRYRTLLDSAHVFAAIILVLFLVMGFDALIQFLERRTKIWRTGTRDAADAQAETGMLPAAVV